MAGHPWISVIWISCWNWYAPTWLTSSMPCLSLFEIPHKHTKILAYFGKINFSAMAMFRWSNYIFRGSKFILNSNIWNCFISYQSVMLLLGKMKQIVCSDWHPEGARFFWINYCMIVSARSKQNENDDHCNHHVITYFNDRLKQVEKNRFKRLVWSLSCMSCLPW